MTIINGLAQFGSGIGIVAAGAFFLLAAIVAFIAFKMLKRTVKMAFRVVLVVVIFGIAAAGSIAFWALGSGSSPAATPRTGKAR